MPSTSTRSNDVSLLEARLRQSKAETHPETTDDDYFLISSIDTLLKNRGLSYQQIEDGIVEGADDGGIDAVFTFQNGSLVEDEDAAPQDVDEPLIELEVIQAKNENGFKEIALQKLIDHLPLLMQLEPDDNLAKEFNSKVLDRFAIFRSTVVQAARRFPRLAIRIHYATKAADPPNEKVERKAARLHDRARESFPELQVLVDFAGAAILNSRARERLTSVLSLKVAEGPLTADKGGLVCLVTLVDYYRFISDPTGRLRDEVFEENVRGYEGTTVINRAIAETLRQGDDSTADFWWLNNGITLLAKRVQSSGKQLVIEDPQVVNGLQTSRNIYQHFAGDKLRPAKEGSDNGLRRHLLVRLIEASDDSIAAQIIKATNSQNRISIATLRATEPFQRKLEEYFGQQGLFYERKKNQYKSQGKPRSHIVEVLELAQAVASVVLCEPHMARGKPSALVREKLYPKVFNEKAPLLSFSKCLWVLRQVDGYLETLQDLNRLERSNIRFHLARAAAAFALQSSRPKAAAIAQSLDIAAFPTERLQRVHEWVVEARTAAEKSTGMSDPNVLAKGAEWSREMDRRFSRYTNKNRWPKRISGPW